MILTRKIGRVLVGKVAPWQAGCGAFLGVMAGFTPAASAPGLFLALFLAAMLLNVNLVVLGAALALARIAALLLAPVLFAGGQLILDGPLGALMQLLINAPVLAYAGFDSYVAVGGMVFGAAFGGLAAVFVADSLGRFRSYLASLDEESPRFREITARRWFRTVSWVLLGGTTRFSELRAQPRARPVRLLGVAALALAAGLGVTFHRSLARPVVTYFAQDTLERFTGATVDLGGAEFDPKAGRLVLRDLAMADSAALHRDLFRAARVEADVGVSDLLRKRFRLDRVVVDGASSGEPRRLRGIAIGEPPRPAPPLEWPDAKGLEDHVRNAVQWKQRLAQARRWIEQLGAVPPVLSREEEVAARRREAEAHGYAQVRARHLVDRAPMLLVADLEVTGLMLADVPGETFRLKGRNLSTAPALVRGALALSLESESGRILASVSLAGQDGGANLVELHWKDLPAEKLAGRIMRDDQPVFAGGTVDLHFAGAINPADATLDLPLEAVLHDSTLLVSRRPLPVERFTVPIVLAGPIDNPAIRLDMHLIGRALAQAGAGHLLDERSGGDLLDGVLRRDPPKRN
ncbi:MAG TPA: hypothetical protein VEB66_14015 [Opitutaceae bacterium]|nr:hypothetical protein [Opitutaceae bacterium]